MPGTEHVASPTQATRQSSRLWPPLLPREHGGWAMLLAPLFVGGLSGGAFTLPVALTIVAAFFVYLARHPLALLARAQGRRERAPSSTLVWLFVYALVAATAGLPLLLVYGLWLLAPLGLLAGTLMVVHLYLATRRSEMSVVGEIVGISGLTLGAPAAYYAASGELGLTATSLWLLSLLYFAGAVFYVKLKVRVHTRREPPSGLVSRLSVGRVAVLYHVAVVGVAVLLVAGGMVPPLAPLAYVPVTCKAVQGALDWRRVVNVKRLGAVEIIHSLIFAVIVIAAYAS